MGTVDKLNQLQSRRNAIALGGGEEKIKKQHDAPQSFLRHFIFIRQHFINKYLKLSHSVSQELKTAFSHLCYIHYRTIIHEII